MGVGSILIVVVKFLLKSVLLILRAVLYGAKLFLLLNHKFILNIYRYIGII